MHSDIALITRARAPYLRGLQEAFAAALGSRRFHLLWPENEHSDFPDEDSIPKAPNIEVHRIPTSGGFLGYQNWPSLALWAQLQKIRPALIWIHEFSLYTLMGLVYAKLNAVPVVVSTEVGCSNAHIFSWSVRAWHQFWGYFVDGVIACSPAARRPLCGEKIPVVESYHAVDARLFNPSKRTHSSGITTFVFVGHLIPRKGIDLLLDAAALLQNSADAAFRVRLIGRDVDRWAEGLIAQRQLQKIVETPGFLSGHDLQEAIRSADVFVLPTREDTYAAVVHEAACLGMPLLISRHAGACEALVVEGETGFSILPEDANGFAEAMRKMMVPELRTQMAQAARKRGEEYSAHVRGAAVRLWMHRHYGV